MPPPASSSNEKIVSIGAFGPRLSARRLVGFATGYLRHLRDAPAMSVSPPIADTPADIDLRRDGPDSDIEGLSLASPAGDLNLTSAGHNELALARTDTGGATCRNPTKRSDTEAALPHLLQISCLATVQCLSSSTPQHCSAADRLNPACRSSMQGEPLECDSSGSIGARLPRRAA